MTQPTDDLRQPFGTDYQPGDIRAGHMLTDDDGWVLIPTDASTPSPGRPGTGAPATSDLTTADGGSEASNVEKPVGLAQKVVGVVGIAGLILSVGVLATSAGNTDAGGSASAASGTGVGGSDSAGTGTDADGGSGAGVEQSASWQKGYQDTWTMLYRGIATPYTTQKEATVEAWCQTWMVYPLSLTQDGHLYDLDAVEAGCVAAVLERGYGPAFE